MNNIKRQGRSSSILPSTILMVLTLLVLVGLSQQALGQGQWTTNGNNINNTNTGNVGIGTAGPNDKLEVRTTTAGQAAISGTTTATSGTSYGIFAQAVGSNSGTNVAGYFSAGGATNNYGIIVPSGNVGFGTSTPSYRLHIAGNNTAAGGYPLIKLQNTQAGGHSWWLYSGANNTAGDFGLYDETDGAYRLYVKGTSGNVGIGTISPAYRLDVQGGAVNASGGLCIAGDCKTAWSQVGGGQWTTSGSNIYYNAGSVGIGTSTPESAVKLHVAGPVLSTGSLGGYSFRNRESSTNIDDWVWYSTGNVARLWRPGSGDLLGVTTSGNLGLGTISPNQKLSVVGTGAFYNSTPIQPSGVRGLFMGNFSGGSSIWSYNYVAGTGDSLNISAQDISLNTYVSGNGVSRLFINNAGSVGIGTTNPNQTLTVSGFNMSSFGTTAQLIGTAPSGTLQNQLNITSSANTWGLILGQNNGGAGTTGYHCAGCAHVVNFNNASLILGTNNTERMTVTGAGNVGVGTTAPAHKLDVQGGAVNASGGLCIAGDCKSAWSQVSGNPSQWTTSGSNIYYSSGNVGIGTAAPTSAKLVISGTAGAEGLDLSTTDQYANLRVIRNSNSGFDKDLFLQYGAGAGSKIHFYSNNSESMTLTAGNLGIGTTTPGAKLDVNGDAHVNGNITATGNIAAKYQDVAEWVPSRQNLAPGTVVVLDTELANHVTASASAYDTRVAGVISAQPGVILGEGGEGKVMVATTGRVKVKAEATRAPIKVGDLLVTSEREGVAMKSMPLDLGGTPIHRPGTLIGKALEPLEKGTGEILVLLSLQ